MAPSYFLAARDGLEQNDAASYTPGRWSAMVVGQSVASMIAGTANGECGTYRSETDPDVYTPSSLFTGTLYERTLILVDGQAQKPARLTTKAFLREQAANGTKFTSVSVANEGGYDTTTCVQDGTVYHKYSMTPA